MPVPLPTLDHLPRRWRASDARVALAALAASGLTAAEFSRRTGITEKRLSRWGLQLSQPSTARRAAGRPPAVTGPARLVELVPTAALVVVDEPAPTPTVLAAVIEVRTPSGWALRIPGELLGDLVGALSARSC